jgi:hypothetical protein
MESLEIVETEIGDWAAVHNGNRVYIADLMSVVKWIRQHPHFGDWYNVQLTLRRDTPSALQQQSEKT